MRGERPDLAPDLYPKIDASYAARGKPQDFEKMLRARLEDAPTDHAARIALARALASKGDTAAAIEALSRAIEVAPEHPALRVELGRLLLASGQEAEALKAYDGLLDALEQGRLSRAGEALD